MAKVTIENTREHDINLALSLDGGLVHQVVVPGAREDVEDRSKTIVGTAEVEEELIEATRKRSEVVEHYFSEGWLRVKKAKAATAPAAPVAPKPGTAPAAAAKPAGPTAPAK